MISEHSAHLTTLPFGFRTWLWHYTCLLLLISMLSHRQAIFESKGDKLSSSAESRIRTWKYIHTYIRTDGRTDRDSETELQTYTHTETNMQASIRIYIHEQTETDRFTHAHTDRQTDGCTDRQMLRIYICRRERKVCLWNMKTSWFQIFLWSHKDHHVK